MGQIETKDSVNGANDLSDRKEIIGKSRGSTSSTDLNIKIDDTSDANKESNDENKANETEKDKKLKKAKTCDFACTLFYAMVALLVFSTMSRTYSHYSGGGCGPLYSAQPLLAYSCVGLACAIIKSLRKHIKEEIKDNSEDPDKENADKEAEVDTGGGRPYEVSTITDETHMNSLNDTKVPGLFSGLSGREQLIMNITSRPATDKSSSGLPLPLPLPPNSLIKRQVSFQTPNEFSALSAVDLKSEETELEKLKNRINEIHASEPVRNDWKDIKFDTEMFKNKDSRQPNEYNWKDYNLNSIDKY